jgi:hypothetical protein
LFCKRKLFLTNVNSFVYPGTLLRTSEFLISFCGYAQIGLAEESGNAFVLCDAQGESCISVNHIYRLQFEISL